MQGRWARAASAARVHRRAPTRSGLSLPAPVAPLAVPVFVSVVSAVALAYEAVDQAGGSPRRLLMAVGAILLAACLGLGVGVVRSPSPIVR